MKRHAIHVLAAALCILSVSLFSCSDSENRHLALLNQAKVIIDLNLDQEKQASAGILETIRRLFVRDAVASTAPASFSMIKVSVTGPDIGAIVREFAPYDTISMNIKAGDLRRFEVTAYVAPGDPSPAASFRGTALANLPAGATVSVPVAMNVDEMRLVVPDYGYMASSGKIVMVDTMKGDNRVVATGSQIFDTPATASYILRPYDIDFDSHLRIYFANQSTSTDSGVFRMKDMNSSFSSGTCEMLANVDQIRSIAIDRKRNVLYYTNNSTSIYRLNLDGGTPTPVFTAAYNVIAVCVDEATGYLYYVYNMTTSAIGYCNPNIEIPSQIYLNTNITSTSVYDLSVKNGFLYAAVNFSPQIAQLPLNFTSSSAPLSLTTDPVTGNYFRGPCEFIAVTSRKLYVIDDAFDGNALDCIIGFNDISGAGWETYNNPGGNFFTFYAC